MKRGSFVVVALLLSGCAEKLPDTPLPPSGSVPQPGVPTRIELNATPGFGQEAGTGTITARVFDAFASALPDKRVSFSASAGTVSPGQVTTDNNGFARASITAAAGDAVTIVAATGGIEQTTRISMQLLPPAGGSNTATSTTTTTTSTTTTTIPFADYSVSLTSTPTSPVAGNPLSLIATVDLVGDAPAPTVYVWDCNDDHTFDGSTTVNTFGGCAVPAASTPATITASVTVAHAPSGLAKTATLKMTMLATPPPTITITCNSPTLPAKTSCTASAKVAGVQVPSARIHRVEWDWGDGTTDATSTPVHTHLHPAAGEWVVMGTVTLVGNPSTAVGTGSATVK